MRNIYICYTVFILFYYAIEHMLFNFFKKQKDILKKKKLLEIALKSMNIPESQKTLYIQALWIASNEEIETLFLKTTDFINNIEMKQIQDIQKQSFSQVAGMRKKEAEERKQEINSFSFLLSNI